MKIRIFISVLAIILTAGACSEEFEPKPLTYTQLLTGKTKKYWRTSALEIRENNVVVVDFDLPSNDCVFDDLYVFYNNFERTFEVQDNALKCNASDPDIFVSDSWSFVNANATIEMVIPWLAFAKLPFIVKELEEDEMTVEIWLDEEATDSYRIYFEAIDEE